MPEVAAADDLGFVRGENEVGLVGGERYGGVRAAVGGVPGGAVVAVLAGGGGEDDEVADGELRFELVRAEGGDAAGTWGGLEGGWVWCWVSGIGRGKVAWCSGSSSSSSSSS